MCALSSISTFQRYGPSLQGRCTTPCMALLQCLMSLVQSLEAFYQESGRAGRDGELAHSILFYSISDRDFLTWLVQKEQGRQSKKRKISISGKMQERGLS